MLDGMYVTVSATMCVASWTDSCESSSKATAVTGVGCSVVG